MNYYATDGNYDCVSSDTRECSGGFHYGCTSDDNETTDGAPNLYFSSATTLFMATLLMHV